MKLEKAVEILNHIQIPLRTAEDHDRFDAIKLGIEALKREEQRRRFAIPDSVDLLPGETKD